MQFQNLNVSSSSLTHLFIFFSLIFSLFLSFLRILFPLKKFQVLSHFWIISISIYREFAILALLASLSLSLLLSLLHSLSLSLLHLLSLCSYSRCSRSFLLLFMSNFSQNISDRFIGRERGRRKVMHI